MTQLVLDPGRIKRLVPQASLSRVVRVRVIAQVTEYMESDAILQVCSVAGPNTDGCGISLRRVDQLDGEATYTGAIVELEGFYDGEEINVYSCCAVDGRSLLHDDGLKTLESIADLDRID